jgi:hypothetical protein
MKTLKTGLIATIAGGVLLGLSSLLAGPVMAQTAGPTAQSAGAMTALPAPAADAAAVACAQGAGAWTDCTLTLNQSIQAGGSVAGTLPAGDGAVLYCEQPGVPQGDPAEQSSLPVCGINGNTAVFLCPNGCGAGTQFVMSALDGQGAAATRELRVTSSGASAQEAAPIGGQPALLSGASGS